MFCNACGNNLAPTARFCTACGHVVGAPNPAPARRSRRLQRALVPALAGVLVLAGAGFGAWHFLLRDPSGALAPSWPMLVSENGKCGAIDRTGKAVVPIVYDGVSEFYGAGVAVFRRGSLFGLVNAQGREVIEPRFDVIQDFESGDLAAVLTGGKWGFIDKTGKIVIQPLFENAQSFDREGGAWVQQGSMWGRIDRTGQFTIPPAFTAATRFDQGLATVAKGAAWGLIDNRGRFVVAPQYSSFGSFSSNGLASVAQGNRQGLINRRGEVVVPMAYDWITSFDDDFSMVKNGAKIGYVDAAGKLAIPLMLAGGDGFHRSDLAPATLDGAKWGFIDRTGRMVIPARFDRADQFVAGHAIVRIGDHAGLVDLTGKVVVPIQYQDLQRQWAPRPDGHFAEQDTIRAMDSAGKWGVMTLNGKWVIQPRLTQIGCFTEEESGD